jgi:hypothetical protein
MQPAGGPFAFETIRPWYASESQLWGQFDETDSRGTFVELIEMCEWEPSNRVRGHLAQFPDWGRDQDRPRITGPALGSTVDEAAIESRCDQELQLVGRPGLDPGTLGLKGTLRSLRDVSLVAPVACFQGIALSGVGLVSWCCRNMRPRMRPEPMAAPASEEKLCGPEEGGLALSLRFLKRKSLAIHLPCVIIHYVVNEVQE